MRSYLSAFSDSELIENYYAPNGDVGRKIANQLVSPYPDPLDALIQLEEHLLEDYGLTFLQAVKAGLGAKRN